MTRKLPVSCLAFALVLAAGPGLACGWWGESIGETTLKSVVTNKSDLAKLDTSTPEGMARMAHAYRLGQGVPQDDLVARRWMTRAARAGHVGAMNDLGQMLEMGIGGPEDQTEAARWYESAAEAGNAMARHSLAMMLFEGRGVARNPQRAERFLRLAAQGGHKSAATDLADRIWDGEIAPKEPHEGCLWSLVAEKLGADGGAENCRGREPDLGDAALAELEQRATDAVQAIEKKGQS